MEEVQVSHILGGVVEGDPKEREVVRDERFM
jgi:hypothetical protein